MVSNEIKYASFTGIVCFALFVIMFAKTGLTKSLFVIPILVLLPIVVYFQFKPKSFFCSPERMMNEAPTVIGIFSNILFSGGSFDTAVRTLAYSGPKHTSKLFTKIVREADCKMCSDIKTGVKDAFSFAPKELSAFRRAMVIVVSAFESDNEEKKRSMMKDAENIVLGGLKEMGESYSARLNTPCMIVFGIGIMIPMILISLFPMMSIGGQFSTPIDLRSMSVIILVVVPVFVLGIILSLKGKNPFFGLPSDLGSYATLASLIAIVPLFLVLKDKLDFQQAFVFSAIGAGLISLASVFVPVLRERKRCKMSVMLQDALFELSNRLNMGENFDVALLGSLSTRKDCSPLYVSMKRELTICRGDVASAIEKVLSPISKEIAGFYCDIYRASMKDVRNSGKLALSIAHQIQDQNSVRKGIELKLKNMLDMMTGTAALFAPLILGMSIVMLGPISNVSDTSVMNDIRPILSVYLVELSALISILSSNLMCKGDVTDMQWRFSLMMPVSLTVFSLCCCITI